MPKWVNEAAERMHRHELRRESILQAAAQCFNKKGFHGTRLEDIARELKVSKAALYYYVKSKEEVLFQCHQALLDIGMEGIRRAEEFPRTPDEKLRAILQYYIENMTDRLKGCVVLLEEGVLSRRLHRQIVRRSDEYERHLRKLVEEGVESGVFVPCDSKMVVFAILGAVSWIPKWYSPTGAKTPKEIAEMFAAYLVRGLESARTDVFSPKTEETPS